MENKDKIKLFREKLSTESDMTDEEYKQVLIDYCNEIDKEPSTNITKEIMDFAKKWKII